MKKLLSIICFVLAFSSLASAQGITIGARGGLNFANQTISSGGVSYTPTSKVGYFLGGYATIMFKSNMGIQPELFLNSVGSTWPASITGGTSETIRLNYFSIPVFFRYNFNDMWHILGGPQFGFLASAKAIGGGQTTDIKSDMNSLDFGVTLGVGVDIGPFNGGLRYNAGLSNTASSSGNFSGGTIKNSAFQVVVGYKLVKAGK